MENSNSDVVLHARNDMSGRGSIETIKSVAKGAILNAQNHR